MAWQCHTTYMYTHTRAISTRGKPIGMQKNHDKTMMKETPIKMHAKPARYRSTFNKLHIVNAIYLFLSTNYEKGIWAQQKHFDKVFVSVFDYELRDSLIKMKISLSNSLLMSFV